MLDLLLCGAKLEVFSDPLLRGDKLLDSHGIMVERTQRLDLIKLSEDMCQRYQINLL